QLPGGATLKTVSYTITGPKGFVKTGSVDVSASTKLTALISGIPAGAGYLITLNATTTDGTTACAGSASFDVLAGKISTVPVALTCHEAARLGSVLVNGTLNICPTIDAVETNPAEVQVGGSIRLAASAHDSDAGPSALSFGWTSTSGTLSNSSA